MEHRWGRRHPVHIPVLLRWCEGPDAWGRIADLSISGALVETGAIPPMLARMEVVLGEQIVPAYVMRRTPGAIALEWRELGAAPVSAVLLAVARGEQGCAAHDAILGLSGERRLHA